jgi:hypothetical protein
MDALRRLFGGGGRAAEASDEIAAAPAPDANGAEAGEAPPTAAPPTADEIDAEERARDLELLRAEQDRLDELVLRQQRYADRSWVPPSQGGPRRSDDGEKSAGEDR